MRIIKNETKKTIQVLLVGFILVLFTISTAGAYGAVPASSSPKVIQKFGLDAGESAAQVVLPNINKPSDPLKKQPSTTWGPINKNVAPYTTAVSKVSAARTGNYAYWVAGRMSNAYKKGLDAKLFTSKPWPNYLTEQTSSLSPAVTVSVPSAASGTESALITGYGAVLGPRMIVRKGTTTLSPGFDYRVNAKEDGDYTIQALPKGKLASGGSVTVRAAFVAAGSAGTLGIYTPLQDYYSARFSFYYAMPSLGSGERDYALQLYTGNGSIENPLKKGPARYINTLTPNWVLVNYNMTAANKSISRASDAFMGMRFVDVKTGQEAVQVGTGPRVDDLALSVFKYGPVRSLSVAREGSRNVVRWLTPVRAVGSTELETRNISYRVWRAEAGTDNFVELTSNSSRLSGTSFSDATAVAGKRYQYLVQAWDSGSGTGYGEMAPRSNPVGDSSTSQTYTVTFKRGTTTVSTVKVKAGSTAKAPSIATPSGYKFMGWYNSAGKKFSATAPVKANATYTARFYSTNAYLKKLSASTGSWSSRFAKTRYAYTLTLARTKSKVKIAAYRAHSKAIVLWSYNKTKWYSGSSKVVSVSRGKVKYLYFKVVSQAKTTKIYRVKVYRKR